MPAFGDFAGLSGWSEALPSDSSLLRFLHLLQELNLAEQILATVNDLLTERGLLLKASTAVDATLIAAPSERTEEEHP